jgi:hypothetical protein
MIITLVVTLFLMSVGGNVLQSLRIGALEEEVLLKEKSAITEFYRGVYATCLVSNVEYVKKGMITSEKLVETCLEATENAKRQKANELDYPGLDKPLAVPSPSKNFDNQS